MDIKVLIICYIILFTTILFNKRMMLLFNIDNTSLYELQIFQWVTIYGSLLVLTEQIAIIIGFAYTYSFFYDGILNKLNGLRWFHNNKKLFKFLNLSAGIILIVLKLSGAFNI